MNPFQPTLRHFIIRQEVIHLYRHAVRASKVIEDPVTRQETIAWIRGELKRNKCNSNVALIEDNVRATRRSLRSLFQNIQ